MQGWTRIVLALWLCGTAGAQGRSFLVDFGDSGLTSGGGSPAWNDVHSANATSSHALVDATGAATGVQLDFTPGRASTSANVSGVTTPTAGSPLALLGWPANATRDNLYGDDGRPRIEFVLSGLDPTASYDFTITASRLGAGDNRSTQYTATGFNGGGAVLDPAENTSEVVTIAGIVPDLGDAIRFSYEAHPSNTNPSGFFYLSAIEVTEVPGGGTGALIGFSEPSLAFSRKQGQGPFGHPVTVTARDGGTPVLGLTAVDDDTGLPPTWLCLPAVASVGAPFELEVDGANATLGQRTATVTASAAGYPDATLPVSFVVRDPAGFQNILYYGNSYSQGNGTVPDLVEFMAEEAGFPAPNTVARLVGGQNLFFHLTDPGQAAAITQALPLGEGWDWVVLQGYSLEATIALGDPAAFVRNAEAIFANVRAHSPNARVCFYQTWARAPGSSVYPGSFPGPLQMHRQIEASYAQAVSHINALHGPGSAVRAAAGETSALFGFDPALYTSDFSHPLPELTVMAAATIFTRIFRTRACDLDPDFGGGSRLVTRLNGFPIDELAWLDLAGIADRAAPRGLRRWPGSGDDLVLRTSVGFAPKACPTGEAGPGDTLRVHLVSPIGLAGTDPWTVYARLDPLARGPNADPAFPEVFYDLTDPAVLLGGGELGPQGVLFEWVLPPGLEGATVLLQGFSNAPSTRTGNGFTTTDAHAWSLSGGPRQRRVAGGGPR